MKTVKFGALTIGGIPRVVGTISSFETLTSFPLFEEKPCDIAEVRLDEIGHEMEWLNTCRAIEESGTPTLVTLRTVSEGGKCNRSESERLNLFNEALRHISAIDVEYKSGLAPKIRAEADSLKKSVVVSYHDFQNTPSPSALSKVITDSSEYADVVKISTMITSASDVQILQDLLQGEWKVPICLIGMGSLGTKTRTGFPLFGSCLTYGYLDTPSAPGQLPATTLVEHLRISVCQYNEDFIVRNQVLEYV